MDLTFYQHKDLVSQALGLLVRHFEQRRVLRDTGLQVQLLVKPAMVGMYTAFDEVLLYLPASPLYLPYISPISPHRRRPARPQAVSPLCLPYVRASRLSSSRVATPSPSTSRPTAAW